jgi:exopolysaccharide biosynthesis polyprenyl glycosylphosphotransferase
MPNSRKDSFTIQFYLFTDALLVWFSFWLASLLGDPIRELLNRPAIHQDILTTIEWVLYIAVPFTPLVLERFGFYEKLRYKQPQVAAWQLIKGIFIIGLTIALGTVFAKMPEAPRLILVASAFFIFIFLFVRDRTTSIWLRRRRKSGFSKEQVVMIGSESEISEFLSQIDQDSLDDWDIIEHFDLSKSNSEKLFPILKKNSISRVIFTTGSTQFEKVASAIEICELQGVEAWIAASFIRTQIARPTFDSVGQKPMLVLRSTPDLSWELLAKTIIDRALSLFIILVTLPLWIFAAIGIKIASPGAPVIFTQWRAGRYGKPFRMFKFRTMVANAEELLKTVKEQHGNEMGGPVFKLDRDPRVFRFGAFLRKFSIDELPQLINVLLGQISIVGPRPLPLYEVEAFSEISHRRRLSVKPGITCEWQIGGRNQITSFEEWVAMDLRYIDKWSLWLDFQIMLKTIPAVLFGKGAK